MSNTQPATPTTSCIPAVQTFLESLGIDFELHEITAETVFEPASRGVDHLTVDNFDGLDHCKPIGGSYRVTLFGLAGRYRLCLEVWVRPERSPKSVVKKLRQQLSQRGLCAA